MKQKEFAIRMFGDAISERMKELEMTKTDLARAAEISLPTLQRALEGRSVRMDTVVAIVMHSKLTTIEISGKRIITSRRLTAYR